MLRAWRICKSKWADAAFSGIGAAENPGRWNSFGNKAVYCAETRSLCALETLVHVENKRLLLKVQFVVFPVDIPETLVFKPLRFPSDWQKTPPPGSTRKLGDRILKAGKFPVMRIPSAVVPGEFCYLINPDHPRLDELTLGPSEPFAFEQRAVLAAGRP